MASGQGGGELEVYLEDDTDGVEDLINIPAIYQRVVLQQRQEEYVQDDQESEEEEVGDYDLTAPPLES